MLHLPDEVREALANGAITEGHARAILMADGEPQRLRLLARVLEGHLSVRETEALAREMNLPPRELAAAEAEAAPGSGHRAVGGRVSARRWGRGCGCCAAATGDGW